MPVGTRQRDWRRYDRGERATCTRSADPTLLECVGISYHGGSTWGMPEIRLETRSDVSFEPVTELVRGENEIISMPTPHRASPVCGENRNKSHAKSSRQGAASETPGVQEIVERASDVKWRSAIETGLQCLSGSPRSFAALRPRQNPRLCLFPSDDVRALPGRVTSSSSRSCFSNRILRIKSF
jgi:hypothetical protein